MPCTTIEFGDAQIELGKPRYPLNAGSPPWLRMNFSAEPSSSRVVTPGLHFERSIVRQRATTSPAAAMLATSSGDFLMIMPGRLPRHRAAASDALLEPQRCEGRSDLVADGLCVSSAVDTAQDLLLFVVGDHRLGFVAVLL